MSENTSGKWLDAIERVGNKLPDPALLFFILLIVVWAASLIFAQHIPKLLRKM